MSDLTWKVDFFFFGPMCNCDFIKGNVGCVLKVRRVVTFHHSHRRR